MSAVKNLLFDLNYFSYRVAFCSGLLDGLKEAYNTLSDEGKRAVLYECAERIGSVREAGEMLGLDEEELKELEAGWPEDSIFGGATEPAYEDGYLAGAEYAVYMAMYACRTRHIPYNADPVEEMGYEFYAKDPYHIPML